MKKTEKFATNGAIIFGLGNGIINLSEQFERMKSNPAISMDWQEFLLAISKGATIGGVGGYLIGWVFDYYNDKEIPLNTDTYLLGLVSNIRLDKSDPDYKMFEEVVGELCSDLSWHYRDKIVGKPLRHGSTVKDTALHDSFDIDVGLKFRPNSFSTTKKMFNNVKDYLNSKIGTYGIFKIRQQSRSLGVFLELNGLEYRVDFAPYKLTKGKKTSGYLFVNNRSFIFGNPTIQKTDIHALKMNSLSETQKRIVLILKDWKNRNELPIPSHLLEYLVKDAYYYNYGGIPKNISQKVIMVLNHIAENLDYIHIHGVENTNNLLTNIGEERKQVIIDACRSVVSDYDYQPNSITNTFSQ